jgi:Fungal Zn(2)-Cys(6) binuclear cluster domain
MSPLPSPYHQGPTPRQRSEESSSRRYACDRCRAHKLRCERDGGAGVLQPCRRCIKARVRCTTGRALRTGRPSQVSKVTRAPQSSSTQTSAGGPALSIHSDVQNSVSHLSPSDPNGLNAFVYSGSSPGLDEFASDALDIDSAFCTNRTGGGANEDLVSCDLGGPTWSPVRNAIWQPNSIAGHGTSGQLDDFVDFSIDPQLPCPSLESASGGQTGTSDAKSAAPNNDIREECLRKLADLHAGLLRDLNFIKNCKKANESDCSGPTSRNSTDEANEDAKNYTHPIGSILNSCEKFIEILQYFARSPSRHSTSWPSYSPFDSASTRCEPDNSLAYPNDAASSSLTFSTPSSSRKGPSTDWSMSSFDFGCSTTSSTGMLQCDVPTTFSILTCYVCVVRIFRIIFSCIYSSLLSAPASQARLPSLFPGLQLHGFQLETHLNLQIQILVHVSDKMLSKIDRMLGIQDGRGRGDGGILEQTTSTTLLQMMMKEEAIETPNDTGGGVKSLREVMASVTQLC